MEQSLGTINYKAVDKYNYNPQANWNGALKQLTDYAKQLASANNWDDAQLSKAISFINKNASKLIIKDSMGKITKIDPEAAYKIYAQDMNYGLRNYTADYNKWHNEQVIAEKGSEVTSEDTIEDALAKTNAGETVDVYDEHADKVNTTSTYAGYKPARNSTDYPAYDAYEQWVSENEANQSVSYEDWYKARTSLDQAINQIGTTAGESINVGVGSADNQDFTGAESAVATQNAIAQGAQEAQTNAENQARASASAGINKARAGMLSENNSQQSQTNNVANNYAANQSQSGSTQADYLQKMAQADALDQQAKNMSKGAGLTALGAGISGAATGMVAGALVSDENCKESYRDEEEELKNAIKQFRELYKRLQSLKGGK